MHESCTMRSRLDTVSTSWDDASRRRRDDMSEDRGPNRVSSATELDAATVTAFRRGFHTNLRHWSESQPVAKKTRSMLKNDCHHRQHETVRRRRRTTEYLRLKSVLPSIAERPTVSKLRVIEEAIRYIDDLHSSLSTKFCHAVSSSDQHSQSTEVPIHPDSKYSSAGCTQPEAFIKTLTSQLKVDNSNAFYSLPQSCDTPSEVIPSDVMSMAKMPNVIAPDVVTPAAT